jgi:hypothetical protein
MGFRSAQIAAFGLLLGAFSSANAATYTYTSISYPPDQPTIAWGINNKGQIVSDYDDKWISVERRDLHRS